MNSHERRSFGLVSSANRCSTRFIHELIFISEEASVVKGVGDHG
jgi:hypothetical protein